MEGARAVAAGEADVHAASAKSDLLVVVGCGFRCLFVMESESQIIAFFFSYIVVAAKYC